MSPDKLNPAPVAVFRKRYSDGDNYMAMLLARRGGMVFTMCSSGDVGGA